MKTAPLFLVKLCFVLVLLLLVERVYSVSQRTKQYMDKFLELDKRPLPQWYDEAKIGIFIHWGVYSVPAFVSEWFWFHWKSGQDARRTMINQFMKQNYPPGFAYKDFAPMFKAELFEPSKWAELFQKAGAKYVVLTSKHHDAFAMYPSKTSKNWNSVDVGPKRDIVGDLAREVRKKNMKFGVYYSLLEWYNPDYLSETSDVESQRYVPTKVWPDIKQLVNEYKPSVLWADGDFDRSPEYWKSAELLAWLYNSSCVRHEVVTNDRWGKGTVGRHGDFYNYADKYNPGVLVKHKWENAFTLHKHSWGYVKEANVNNILTMKELLKEIVTTVSCGGNVLVNVGPTKEGIISPIFQERLLDLGKWLSINGEAIYSTTPWKHQRDSANKDVWYTSFNNRTNAVNATDGHVVVYAMMLTWPSKNQLKIRDIFYYGYDLCKVKMLGQDEKLNLVHESAGRLRVQLPDRAAVKSEFAWTLKFTC